MARLVIRRKGFPQRPMFYASRSVKSDPGRRPITSGANFLYGMDLLAMFPTTSAPDLHPDDTRATGYVGDDNDYRPF